MFVVGFRVFVCVKSESETQFVDYFSSMHILIVLIVRLGRILNSLTVYFPAETNHQNNLEHNNSTHGG